MPTIRGMGVRQEKYRIAKVPIIVTIAVLSVFVTSDYANSPAVEDVRIIVEQPSRAAIAGEKPVELSYSEPSPADYGLPAQSFVATAIGDGVVSFASPEETNGDHWFPSPTQFDGPRVFLVADQTSSDTHIKVSLPIRPNGQEGWIPRSEVEISQVEHKAVINLTERSLIVWDGDEPIVQTKAVTGSSVTPTPLGRFFVRDIIKQGNPGGDYGPYILALSGFSEALETFAGALPAIAIHGTSAPELIGQSRSNGCVRVPNELIELLAANVPLGTPVVVVQ